MSSAKNPFTVHMEALLTKAIEERIRELMKTHADEIYRELEREADSMALRVLKHYDIESFADRLVISVRKGESDE